MDELHRRFGDGPPPTTVRLRGLSGTQHHAIADLLGAARLPRDPVRLRVELITIALGLGSVDDLRAVVEQLRGPITNRRAARADQTSARQVLWSWLDDQILDVTSIADPDRWVAAVRAWGVRDGPDRHRTWLGSVLSVLRALPADGVTLAELAQDVLGNPHALDLGRSVPAFVVEAVAPGHDRGAESVRAAWESVGVAPDALSSTALSLGLTAPAAHPLAGWLARCRSDGEPTVLTLAQLRRWPLPPAPPGDRLFVVENPSLVAAAARDGWTDCPVLISSSGRPTVAVVTLIRQLTAAGARAFQHADFDAAGIAITRWLSERAGTVPWQMDAAAYSDAASKIIGDHRAIGPVGPTPWDAALAIAMAKADVPVYEEQLRGSLLAAVRGVED